MIKKELDELKTVLNKLQQICSKWQTDAAGNDNLINEQWEISKSLSPVIMWARDMLQDAGSDYAGFFEEFLSFMHKCSKKSFFAQNMELFYSTMQLFIECLTEIEQSYASRLAVCPCCKEEVIYNPIHPDYKQAEKTYDSYSDIPETLNHSAYNCPLCGCTDRDRLIIHFLEQAGIRKMPEGSKLLHIAPAPTIAYWVQTYAPHIAYESTDLHMQNVTYNSDIQNMDMVAGETYDVIICSHVLQHVKDDRKALRELKRILKPEGLLVFLAPVDLSYEGIDEAWGLTEEENQKRFGQGDHCRRYGKSGLLERLSEEFHVHALNKDYFGGNAYARLQLTDTSTLYILTKNSSVSLNLQEQIEFAQEFLENGPLVSVIFTCYNHEKYVGAAMESVLNQTYKNLEILVVDDGSPDNSAAVLKQYSSHYAAEFYFTENCGDRSFCLLERATGKYLAIMHSDDIWEPDKVALQVKYMEEHPEIGGCFTWCAYTDEDLNELPDATFYQTNKTRYEWMNFFWHYGNALCHPSLVIKSELYKNMPPAAERQLPDFYMWVRLVQKEEIYVLPKVLIYMRRYLKANSQNTSARTNDTITRMVIEHNARWYAVISQMEDTFFLKAFQSELQRADAASPEEVVCEKFFLFLNSRHNYIQDNAFRYFILVYADPKIAECFLEKYHYGLPEFWQDMVEKGYGKKLLTIAE